LRATLTISTKGVSCEWAPDRGSGEFFEALIAPSLVGFDQSRAGRRLKAARPALTISSAGTPPNAAPNSI
jgi:hypothetical protein